MNTHCKTKIIMQYSTVATLSNFSQIPQAGTPNLARSARSWCLYSSKYQYRDVTQTSWCYRPQTLGLFIQRVVNADIKENTQVQHYWSSVMGIQRWLVDSPHKGPVTQNVLPEEEILLLSTPGMTITECLSWLNYNDISLLNSLRPSDAYILRYKYQHWFR